MIENMGLPLMDGGNGIAKGVVIGVSATKRAIRIAINKADICPDDKRFIRGVLGIPQNGERQ